MFNVDVTGKDVTIIIASPSQKRWAWDLGHGNPIFMDASHGMQRYGLKIVTVHVRNHCGKGANSFAVDVLLLVHNTTSCNQLCAEI